MLLVTTPGLFAQTQPTPPLHRAYSHLLEPREHPNYNQRTVKPAPRHGRLSRTALNIPPASANRFEQCLNSQRHFEKMGDGLSHKRATLVSLNFGR